MNGENYTDEELDDMDELNELDEYSFMAGGVRRSSAQLGELGRGKAGGVGHGAARSGEAKHGRQGKGCM